MANTHYINFEQLEQIDPGQALNDIHIIAPSQSLLLKTVEIPKASFTKLQQAVPYALEEDLIDDVETLHFALGEWEDGKVGTAVIAKTQLRAWLDELQTRHITAQSLIPSIYALPWQPKQWTLALFEGQALLRTGKQTGLHIDQHNLTLILQTLINEAGEHLPEKILIYQYNHHAIPEITLPHEVIDNPPEFLQLAQETLSALPSINLLQGAYKPKQKISSLQKNWRLAGFIAIAWIMVWIIGDISAYFYYRWQTHRYQQQVAVLFKQAFPDSQKVVEPKKAVERQLKRLQQAASGGTFLNILANTGQIMKKNNDVTVESMHYNNNILRLKISTVSFAKLAQFSQQLRQQGLKVKQSNVTTKDKTISAQVAISQ